MQMLIMSEVRVLQQLREISKTKCAEKQRIRSEVVVAGEKAKQTTSQKATTQTLIMSEVRVLQGLRMKQETRATNM